MGVVGEERQLIADAVILSGLNTFQSKSRMEGGGSREERQLIADTVILSGLIYLYLPKDAGAHPYIGIIVCAFAVIQPIMALFRPHPGTPK